MAEKPAYTERAQIVVAYTSRTDNLVIRFATAKKGEKEFNALFKAWKTSGPELRLHQVNGDMFVSIVDLYNIASVSYVDFAKSEKFIPFQG